MDCLLCCAPLPPGSRAFIKSKDDILSCLKSLFWGVDLDLLDEFLCDKVLCRKCEVCAWDAASILRYGNAARCSICKK